MFDSLDEQMKHDQEAEAPLKERILRWTLIVLVSVVVVGGVFAGIHFLGRGG